MYRSLLADATFHNLLLAFDADLAETARAGHCPVCGGVLHSAKFMRKPRGRACKLGPEHDLRFSFCCAVDGCRKRETPPSLRFLGAKVYLAVTVVLIAIMRHGADGRDRRRPPHYRALAAMVARQLYGDAVLAGGSGSAHAADRAR